MTLYFRDFLFSALDPINAGHSLKGIIAFIVWGIVQTD